MSLFNTFNSVMLGARVAQPTSGTKQINLANQKELKKQVLAWQKKSLSLVRSDVKQWKTCWQMTTADEPKNYSLQLLFDTEIMQDALLTSQMENRINKALKTEFSIKAKKSGEKDEDQTMVMTQSTGVRTILNEILLSYYLGYSLLELAVTINDAGDPELIVTSVPRTNVVPQNGRFYSDYSEDRFVEYRNVAEYGSYILEFDSGGVGLLNKVVPHVLFKKFAFSCWSELCEIFGIPPRVMKTDTQNPSMLNRAKQMMMDTGAAAWFIIDESEKFEWGQGVQTNGDVFKQLIASENNEIAMLISGAIIGQDTTNGNRSKDESSREVLMELVQSDLKRLEMIMNSTVIPALIKIGFLKGDVRFEFDATEDLDSLWSKTKESWQEFNVDPEWVKNKFGIEITGVKESKPAAGQNLQLDFFD